MEVKVESLEVIQFNLLVTNSNFVLEEEREGEREEEREGEREDERKTVIVQTRDEGDEETDTEGERVRETEREEEAEKEAEREERREREAVGESEGQREEQDTNTVTIIVTEMKREREGEGEEGRDGEVDRKTETLEEDKRKEETETDIQKKGERDGGMEGREAEAGSQDDLEVKPTGSETNYRDRLDPRDTETQCCRLSPDFPDYLWELLVSLQEGRRLNDQRCSFRRSRRGSGEGGRGCHSEPGTPQPRHRVVFSSMTSLQKEEFFDLVATSQARRLDDQRAELHDAPPLVTPIEPPPSTRQERPREGGPGIGTARGAGASKPAAKEELYSMILNCQSQGRLEDQRSAPPGPVDDEDFFSLLLRVQGGGRMEEQRTELPLALRERD